jgi:Tol biopolymer transport system component
VKRMTLVAAGLAALAALAAAPAHATFPGENGRLVFQRPIGEQSDLFTIKPSGKALHRRTRTRLFEDRAEWSADGRHLAFAGSNRSGSREEIWTMSASGRQRRALTSFRSISAAPTWSPDGRIGFFTLSDFPPPASDDDPPPPAEIHSMAADGTDDQRLTNDDEIQTDPTWSPDGSSIAYIHWCEVPGEEGAFDLALYVMNRDGTGQRPLLDCSAKRFISNANWSPDGRRLVFEVATARPSGRSSGRQSDIAVINADGTGLRRLTRTAALETHPVWSPDGRRIAFTSDRHARRGRLEPLGPAFELYTMRADGRDVRRITRNRVPDLHPNWQPIP